MKRTLILGFLATAAVFCAEAATRPFEMPDNKMSGNKVDVLVSAQLKKLDIKPAELCSDSVFVRRAYLDVIGTLPTMAETRSFLESKKPGKRSALIDKLLERDEFADYWTMKWSDVLRVKSEFPINLWPNAVQTYHRWIRNAIKGNMPYDKFARELLTSSGSNFRVAPVNFYRSMQSKEPEELAKAVALAFMGTRLESLPKKQQLGMAAFFSQVGFKGTAEWKEEVIFYDASKGLTNEPALRPSAAIYPDGTPAKLRRGRDPRIAFANWLTTEENEWFARNGANRIWYWIIGQGIVHEPDDFKKDNPPANPELLNFLAAEFVKSNYDVKQLCRLILNSRTYQSSSIPRSNHEDALANFAFYPVRRLEAEVLIDAICQITGTTETYSSKIPEPFTYVPKGQRTIALSDGSINSPFLEMFGRPPRDTGLISERNNNPTAPQRLHMLNSSHIRKKYEQSGKLRGMLRKAKGPKQIANRLYMTILSRYPTQEEIAAISDYADSDGINTRAATIDLTWTLFNSKEFLYRH
jgi:hypothetical protein